MARPVHRLNLRLLPPDESQGLESAVARLEVAGFTADGGRPMIDGGWEGWSAVEQERPVFLSSGIGGFRVFCPVCGASVGAGFVGVLGGWRAGGSRELVCGCGQRSDLAALRYLPEAGFARSWLELRDVQGTELRPEAMNLLTAVWGGLRVLAHRG